jgi:hypothetical protein
MIIGIHQPNFFPWFGYFVKIVRSDIFVFLDDVQLVKTGSSYTNRTSLNINGNSQYFSVPIKRSSGTQLINQCCFANNVWQKKLKGTLQVNYSKAPYFKENIDLIHSIIDFNTDSLSEFNVNAIVTLAEHMGIKNTYMNSFSMSVKYCSTEKLVGIIKLLNGDTYLSGIGAKKYQEEEIFEKNHIKILYNEFEHPIYHQNNSELFIKNLSILDLLFNLGKNKVRKRLLSLKY